METITHPHDKYFRSVMQDLRVAKGFLTAYLSKKISTKIDWDSLKIEPSHHIDPHLKEMVTDMLYSVKFGKRAGYVSILVEHQSTADPWMAFRVHCYVMQIMRGYHKRNPQEDLPLVLPLVFYTGKAPHNHTLDIFSLFGENVALARETFLQPIPLIDLKSIPDKELQQHTWSGMMELVQKHISEKNITTVIQSLATFFKEIAEKGGDDYIYATLKYLFNMAPHLKNAEQFVSIINNSVSTECKEKLMSLANICREEGHILGREEGHTLGLEKGEILGIVKGREEGETIGLEKGETIGLEKGELLAKKAMAKKMREQGMELALVSTVTGVSIKELQDSESLCES